MSKTLIKTEVVTGNRLTDGLVVYLAQDKGWVEKVEDAAVANDDESRAVLQEGGIAALNRQEITHWEFVGVEIRNGEKAAIKNKEAIRSRGPTIRRDLGKQAELYA